MRLAMILVTCVLMSGCLFTRTVYVEPARTPLPIIQRPAIIPNAESKEDLRSNQQMLMEWGLLWEGVVLRRNEAILKSNEAGGYPTDPDSIYPRAADGGVARPTP